MVLGDITRENFVKIRTEDPWLHDPKYAQALYFMDRVYKEGGIGNIELAVDCVDSEIERVPNSPLLHVHRAEGYGRLAEYHLAEGDEEKAREAVVEQVTSYNRARELGSSSPSVLEHVVEPNFDRFLGSKGYSMLLDSFGEVGNDPVGVSEGKAFYEDLTKHLGAFAQGNRIKSYTARDDVTKPNTSFVDDLFDHWEGIRKY